MVASINDRGDDDEMIKAAKAVAQELGGVAFATASQLSSDLRGKTEEAMRLLKENSDVDLASTMGAAAQVVGSAYDGIKRTDTMGAASYLAASVYDSVKKNALDSADADTLASVAGAAASLAGSVYEKVKARTGEMIYKESEQELEVDASQLQVAQPVSRASGEQEEFNYIDKASAVGWIAVGSVQAVSQWAKSAYRSNDSAEERDLEGKVANPQTAQDKDSLSVRIIESMVVNLMDPVVYGVTSQNGVKLLESTADHRDRLLAEHQGDVEAALDAVSQVEPGSQWAQKVSKAILGAVPFAGPVSSLVIPLFVQMREIALVASMRGYDITDDDIKSKILMCIVVGAGTALPKQALNLAASKVAAKFVAKKIVNKAGQQVAKRSLTSWLPIGAVYDLLTDDAPTMFERAREMFPPKNQMEAEFLKLTDKPGGAAEVGEAGSGGAKQLLDDFQVARLVPPQETHLMLLVWLLMFLAASFLRLVVPSTIWGPVLPLAYMIVRGFALDDKLTAQLARLACWFVRCWQLPRVIQKTKTKNLKDEKGSFQVPKLGKFDYEVKEMSLDKLDYHADASKVQMTLFPGRRRLAVIADPSLEVEFSARFNYHRSESPNVPSGGFRAFATARPRAFLCDLEVCFSQEKGFHLKVLKSEVRIEKVRVRVEDSTLSWVINVFETVFQNEILKLLEKELSIEIGLQIEKESATDIAKYSPIVYGVVGVVLSLVSLSWIAL